MPESYAGSQGFQRGGFGVRRDPGGPTLLLICIAKKNGAVLWQRELDQGNQVWNKQNASSPSPVTDGKHVWVVTGTGAVAAFTMEGKLVWRRHLQRDYGLFGLNWGYASSPLLHEGKLIIQVLHGSHTNAPSYLLALNALTGKEVWRQERPTDAIRESPDAYTTPALLAFNGKTQIVVSGGDYITGHDPRTGKEIWRAGGLNPYRQGNYRIVASPVVMEEMVYVPSRRRPLLAVRAGGTGDVTASHIVWKWDDRGGPDVPTPVSDGKYFYMVDDSGMVTCLDAKSGKRIWGPERTAPGIVDSSPLLADAKLYIVNENAVTTVLATGPQFKVLATNMLDGSYTLSSPAISGNHLFIRTATHLYCIGKKPVK
jgi:outer membrane protein assembly factor BamB